MKISCSILCFVFLSTASQAQTLLPHLGVAISKNTIEPWQPTGEVSTVTGFKAGVGFEFKVVKKLQVLVACDYIGKGYKYHSETDNGSLVSIYSDSYKHNYLEFPVMLKRYFLQGPIKLYFNGGLYCAIGIGGKYGSEFGTYKGSNAMSYLKSDGSIKYGPDVDPSEDRWYDNRIDYGYVFGGGIVLFDHVSIDVCYDIGKVNLDDDFGDYKNRSLQFSVGVPIRLGKSE